MKTGSEAKFEKIATPVKKIDFFNFYKRYEKIPVTKVLNVFEHFPKKTFGCHTIKIENSNFKNSTLLPSFGECHKVFKMSSEISDVLVKFTASNGFEFFIHHITSRYIVKASDTSRGVRSKKK